MRPSKKLSFLFLGAGLVLLVTVGILFLVPAQAVSAQCGSQASSCKNCHETQAKDPVNNDGTAWHTSHAFGDFCYLCHGGNNQATDETTAHAGMVNPLADVMTSCKSCHASDYQPSPRLRHHAGNKDRHRHKFFRSHPGRRLRHSGCTGRLCAGRCCTRRGPPASRPGHW